MMSAAAAAANSRVQLMMMVIRRCNFGKSSRGYLSIHPPGKLYATSPRFVTRCNLATPVGGHVVGRRRSSAFRSRNCRLLSVVVATQSLAAEARRRHMIGRRLATIISLLLLLRHMIAVNYWWKQVFFIFRPLWDIDAFFLNNWRRAENEKCWDFPGPRLCRPWFSVYRIYSAILYERNHHQHWSVVWR